MHLRRFQHLALRPCLLHYPLPLPPHRRRRPVTWQAQQQPQLLLMLLLQLLLLQCQPLARVPMSKLQLLAQAPESQPRWLLLPPQALQVLLQCSCPRAHLLLLVQQAVSR